MSNKFSRGGRSRGGGAGAYGRGRAVQWGGPSATIVAERPKGGISFTRDELAKADESLIAITSSIGKEIFRIEEGLIAELEKFSYEGFNPETVYKHFAVVLEELSKDGGIEAAKTKFRRALVLLIGLHLEVGALTSKNYGRMGDEGQQLIDKITGEFRISTVPRPAKNDITIQRVANAFPVITCQLAAKKGRHWGEISAKLPKAMLCAAFPSTIPRDQSYSGIREVLLELSKVYAGEQALVINPGMYESLGEAIAVQEKYVTASFNSPVLSDVQRVQVFRFLFDTPDRWQYVKIMNSAFHAELDPMNINMAFAELNFDSEEIARIADVSRREMAQPAGIASSAAPQQSAPAPSRPTQQAPPAYQTPQQPQQQGPSTPSATSKPFRPTAPAFRPQFMYNDLKPAPPTAQASFGSGTSQSQEVPTTSVWKDTFPLSFSQDSQQQQEQQAPETYETEGPYSQDIDYVEPPAPYQEEIHQHGQSDAEYQAYVEARNNYIKSHPELAIPTQPQQPQVQPRPQGARQDQARVGLLETLGPAIQQRKEGMAPLPGKGRQGSGSNFSHAESES